MLTQDPKTTAPLEGVLFSRGDNHIIVPALPIGRLRKEPLSILIAKDEKSGTDSEGNRKATVPYGELFANVEENRIPVILAAVKQNYPNATAEDLEDWVTFDSSALMYRVAMGVRFVSDPPLLPVRRVPPPAPTLAG